MTDWKQHDGGPQPVADDVLVTTWSPDEGGWRIPASAVDWSSRGFQWRVINQHLIDAAREEGFKAGLEAAAKVASEKVEKRIGVPCPDGVEGCLVFHFRREYHDKSASQIEHEIRDLSYQIDNRNPSAGFIGQTEKHDDG